MRLRVPGKWRPTHRHKKGGLYRVLGQAILEADRSDVVIYDDADGATWVRSRAEFEDGRFTPLAPSGVTEHPSQLSRSFVQRWRKAVGFFQRKSLRRPMDPN
ncbi:MAG: DUF1653 domain-containing protein [Pseudomonadota bacterium]